MSETAAPRLKTTVLDTRLREVKERELTAFDELLQRVIHERDQFLWGVGQSPKRVFLGFTEMEAFKNTPLEMVAQGPSFPYLEDQVAGLEVVRVLKESFIQVA